MQTDVQRHDMLRFFIELNEDQCHQLQQLFTLLGDPAAVAHYSGFLLALMQTRFNLCAACGKNHDAEATAIADGDIIDPVPQYAEVQIVTDDDE
jgi:hypothetical protein